MRTKTHLAIGALFIILFVPHVVHVTTFIITFLIATLMPNLDGLPKTRGKIGLITKPLRIILKPRGALHSFTIALAITAMLAWNWPTLAFPYFLGYGLHLLTDAWTTDGIRPFWPHKKVSKGKVHPGGPIEETVFMIFIILDIGAALLHFL